MDDTRSTPDPAQATLRLRLYVAGNTPRSSNAIDTLRRACAENLQGEYLLEVIDIYQQPALAREAQILATPTLVRTAPTPKKILIGDLSQTGRLLNCLRGAG